MHINKINQFNVFSLFGTNCTDICMLNIVNHYHGEFYLALMEMFDFRYNQKYSANMAEKDLIGARFAVPAESISPLCEKYYNTTWHEISIIDKCMKESLTLEDIHIAETSLHLCKWRNEYNKNKIKHFFIILGIESENVLFADPMLSADIKTMSIDEINQIVYKLYKANYQEIDYPNITEIIKDSDDYISKLDLETPYNDFIRDLNEKDDLHDEFKDIDTHYWFSCMDRTINYFIAGSRGMYSLYLNWLYEKTKIKELIGISNEFVDLKKRWHIVRTAMIKSDLSKNYNINKHEIITMINKIKQKEQYMQEQLQQCFARFC